MDRLSALPDFIFHQILSHLDYKEVAQTCLVSKRWLLGFETFPFLEFNQYDLAAYDYFDSLEVREAMLDKFHKYVDDVLRSFDERRLCVKRFKLRACCLNASFLDKWVGLLVDNLVEYFDLELDYSLDHLYTVPQILYSAKSLKELSLRNCILDLPLLPGKLVSLRKIILRSVQLDDQVLRSLISNAPYVEDVEILMFNGLQNIEISGAERLRRIKIDGSAKLKKCHIDLPSLEEISLIHVRVLDYSPSSFRINSSPSSGLKDIQLWYADITDQDLHQLLASSPGIVNLSLYYCVELECLNISSDKLLGLVIDGCPKLVGAHIDAPSLRNLGFVGKMLSSFSLNSLVCSVDIRILYGFSIFNWRKLFSKPVHSRHFKLQFNFSSEILYNEEELGEISIPALWQVDVLEILVIDHPPNNLALLDSMLSTCKPRTLIVMMNLRSNVIDHLISLSEEAQDKLKILPFDIFEHGFHDIEGTNFIDIPCRNTPFQIAHFKLRWLLDMLGEVKRLVNFVYSSSTSYDCAIDTLLCKRKMMHYYFVYASVELP